jgi:hypothetical protein
MGTLSCRNPADPEYFSDPFVARTARRLIIDPLRWTPRGQRAMDIRRLRRKIVLK